MSLQCEAGLPSSRLICTVRQAAHVNRWPNSESEWQIRAGRLALPDSLHGYREWNFNACHFSNWKTSTWKKFCSLGNEKYALLGRREIWLSLGLDIEKTKIFGAASYWHGWLHLLACDHSTLLYWMLQHVPCSKEILNLSLILGFK